jgi:hypothetical protein
LLFAKAEEQSAQALSRKLLSDSKLVLFIKIRRTEAAYIAGVKTLVSMTSKELLKEEKWNIRFELN